MASEARQVPRIVDETSVRHCYHVSLFGVATSTPLPVIADVIAPSSESPLLAAFTAATGYLVVATKLQVYKETLPTKFGFVTYCLLPASAPHESDGEAAAAAAQLQGAELDAKLHSGFAEWVVNDMAMRFQTAFGQASGVKLLRAPPTEEGAVAAYSCCEYLRALRNLPLVKDAEDGAKMEAFLLTKLVADGDQGRLALHQDAVTFPELAWLRGNHSGFPKIADSASITAFLSEGVSPLIQFLAMNIDVVAKH